MRQISQQAASAVQINRNFEAVEPGSLFGIDWTASVGTVFAYYGASKVWTGFTHIDVADGTIALSGNATNRIMFNQLTLAVSQNTTGFSSNPNLRRIAEIVTSTTGITTYTDYRQSPILPALQTIVLRVGSDETTAITTGTNKFIFRMPYAFQLLAVKSSLAVVSSSGNPTVDINEAGTSVLGASKLSIDASEKTSATAATATTIADDYLAADAEISIDIDTSGTGAAGLKVYLIGRQAEG